MHRVSWFFPVINCKCSRFDFKTFDDDDDDDGDDGFWRNYSILLTWWRQRLCSVAKSFKKHYGSNHFIKILLTQILPIVAMFQHPPRPVSLPLQGNRSFSTEPRWIGGESCWGWEFQLPEWMKLLKNQHMTPTQTIHLTGKSLTKKSTIQFLHISINQSFDSKKHLLIPQKTCDGTNKAF